MKKYTYSLIAATLLCVSAANATVLNLSTVGRDAGTPDQGTLDLPVGGTDLVHVYTIFGLDLDGDSTGDSIELTVTTDGQWNGSAYEKPGGGQIAAGDVVTFSVEVTDSDLSSGNSLSVNSVGFTSVKMNGWQSNEAYTVETAATVGGAYGAATSHSVNTALLPGDPQFRVSGVTNQFRVQYFGLSVDLDVDAPSAAATYRVDSVNFAKADGDSVITQVGTPVVGGSTTSHTYTVSDLDLDDDGLADPFELTVNVVDGAWDSSNQRYTHSSGGAMTAGDTMTFSYGGVSGIYSSNGASIADNGFTFDFVRMTSWDAGVDVFSVTGVAGDVTEDFSGLNQSNAVTVTAGSGATFYPEYIDFTVRLGVPLPTATTANGKNLIWIITDEHNLRTLGCYRDTMSTEQAEMWGENAVVETPNLDAMADNGALFTRMYVSTPICTPNRGSMFTGIYAHKLTVSNNSSTPGDGKFLRANVKTIAEVLVDVGYTTGYAGKWHVSEKTDPDEFWQPHPVGAVGHNYGFEDNNYMFNGGHDKWYGFRSATAQEVIDGRDPDGDGMVPYKAGNSQTATGSSDSHGIPYYTNGQTSNVQFSTDWLTTRALEFVTENKAESFFYVLSIPDPHTADSVRAPYDTMYTEAKTGWTYTVPRTWNNPNYDPVDPTQTYGDNPGAWMVADGKAGNFETDEGGSYTIQDKIPQYFGMVRCIDDNIGRLITHLNDEGVLEDTILIFTADHGDMFGEHQRVNKGAPWDMSARIPFILVDGSQLLDEVGGAVSENNPIVPRGIIVEESGTTVDWMETCLSLLEVDNIPDTAGIDLTPLLSDTPVVGWDDVSVIRKGGWYAATSKRYKLVVSNSGATWLFDKDTDPDEFVNQLLFNEVANAATGEGVESLEEQVAEEAITAKLAQAIKRHMRINDDPSSSALAKVEALIDGWASYAGLLGLAGDMSSDADSDGFLDVDEFNAGSDPLDAYSVPAVGLNAEHAFLHVTRYPAVASAPTNLIAEWTHDLGSNTWYDIWSSETELPDESGFFTVQRVPDTSGLSETPDKLFYRLRMP